MNKNKTVENQDLATRFEFLEDLPNYISVTDTENRFQGISGCCLKFLDWDFCNQAIGKTYYDIPNDFSKIADSVVNFEKKVIDYNKVALSLLCFHYKGSVKAMIVDKKPVYDKEKKVIGIVSSITDITNIVIKKYELLNQLDKKYIDEFSPKLHILTPEFSPLPLSKRQQECLSLIMRGKTIKEIAYILGISYRTAEGHIQVIKHKLGCNNKSQLIEKAIDSGFLFHVPEILFGLKT
ncbi:MAG: hypothetical protein HRU35_03575 [Rickettsiaceae bacterium]|nr:hypothetical protein [Rickettsiaceae bacterium]